MFENIKIGPMSDSVIRIISNFLADLKLFFDFQLI